MIKLTVPFQFKISDNDTKIIDWQSTNAMLKLYLDTALKQVINTPNYWDKTLLNIQVNPDLEKSVYNIIIGENTTQ